MHHPRVRFQLVQVLCIVALLLVGTLQQYGVIAHDTITVHHDIAKRPYTFPNGGRTLFPTYRMVALYGYPNVPVLGALGDQSLTASIARAKALARQYQPFVGSQYILPTLEIISTVASASPMSNHSYSYSINLTLLRSWVMTAQQNGVYIVLDLQPGRQSFPVQAAQFTSILSQPNVGLALDPEWRLGPHQVPLEQIGSVSIDEVNQTAAWLADLTKQHNLPQKLFLLHEFRLSMLPNRSKLDTTHPELAYAIQMDGQGTQPVKLDTWHAILADPPAGVHFGWKNFYHKDAPLRSPAQTMQLTPQPWYISYQ